MNEDPGLLKTLLDWSWTVAVGAIGVVWKINDRELSRQRDVSAKIFDKISDHESRDEDRFRDVTKQITDGFATMTTQIHANHAEMLRALPKRKRN